MGVFIYLKPKINIENKIFNTKSIPKIEKYKDISLEMLDSYTSLYYPRINTQISPFLFYTLPYRFQLGELYLMEVHSNKTIPTQNTSQVHYL